MKITFKEDNNAAIIHYENGDTNINPKFISKFGYIKGTIDDNGEIHLNPQGFVFDCKGKATAINIEKKLVKELQNENTWRDSWRD